MQFETRNHKVFIFISCAMSLLHAVGYIWHGVQIGFNWCIYAMIFCDLLYIPAILIRNGRLLFAYLLFFTTVLVCITAFTDSRLYNNYSGLLCIFICIILFPRYKNYMMDFYLIITAIAFVLDSSPSYYLVIHTARSIWVFLIYDIIIYNLYNRKPVILYEDEKKILDQLSNDKYMKEIELNGLSERTIRRKLDKAKKRNGCQTTEDLKELYISTYKK